MPTDEISILQEIVKSVRGYRGVLRKRDIGMLSSFFNGQPDDLLAAKGEDAAVFKIADKTVAFAADGLMREFVEANPQWAGYCSVLVNVNDMLAVRARPKYAVNVISARNDTILTRIVSGMNEACEKFNVRMVGGHLHPDADSDSISVSMIGEVEDGCPLLSSTGQAGEKIIMITDCDGEFTESIPYSWDCTSKKSASELDAMVRKLLAALKNFSAGKDISNPGLLGTLAMLLESSGIGGDVDVGEIAQPSGTNLVQWLTSYHGMGFIGTAPQSNVGKIADLLSGSSLSMAVIGETIFEKKLVLRMGNAQSTLYDLSKEKITGLF
ncbi:MAG: AIR synthase related protein [Thermoplasmata archaeon]|nr:AIR synthase related protein [Thermoplasmata archaeon]